MRVLAVVIAAFVCSSVPGGAAAPPVSREDALVALCRVWNAVRFMHPALAAETDATWDDALVAAEPLIERDPAAVREAAAAMFAPLHDPATTVDSARADAPPASPSAEDRDGVRIVRVNGYPGAALVDVYAKALGDAFALPAGTRALVVDLRAPVPASFAQMNRLETAWSQVGVAARFAGGAAVSKPLLAQRYFLGFPDESGTPNGGYREGRESVRAALPIVPVRNAEPLLIAFVTGANALVPDDAIALERAGRAAIFSADGAPGVLPGDEEVLDAGAGLPVAVRTIGLIEAPVIRSGDVDAALAWTRNPSAAPAPTTPPAPPDIAKRFADPALPDEAHRVLAAFRMWGAIAYLFPYKNLMHDDWDGALRTALVELHAVRTPLEYDTALVKMYAHIHDTHGFISAPALSGAYGGSVPFIARDVEGKPTIVAVDPVAAKRDGFAVGDVVETVDGETVAARAARLRPYVVASTEQSAREVLDSSGRNFSLFGGPARSTVELRLHGADGRTRTVRTTRQGSNAALSQRKRPIVDVLPGNVGYIDLPRLKYADAEAALTRLASTRALVFDLRGYPQGTAWVIAPHLTASTVRAAYFRTPVRRVPVGADSGELQYVDQTRDFYQLIKPAPPRYAKPVVVVIDARAISQAEHTGLYLRAAGHARFVGQPTMGANGDVTGFFLPGGIRANFTGQAVEHPDGTQLQRVGLIPDVPVAPTLRGVRAGDDELLSAGLREALRLARADATSTRAALNAERVLERADAVARVAPPPPVTVAPSSAPPLPDAFAVHGDGYDAGHDAAVRHADGRTIVLRTKPDAAATGFGTYTETIPLDGYRGKRVRVTGYLRTADATRGSFWLRVDGPNRELLAFDNMDDRALTGTHDWTPFAIVVDVPQTATNFVGGLLLAGTGTLWADDLRIDVVDQSVPTTGTR